jgi:NADH-quinone oxidoreductase subunit M
MTIWEVPWLELAIALALAGSLSVSCIAQPLRAFRLGLAFSAAALAAALLAWLLYEPGHPPGEEVWSIQTFLLGRWPLAVDSLSAPLVALVALLHFLTALATGRTKMRRFSLAWSLAALAIRLALFACQEPWLLIGLLSADTLPGYVELANRRRSTRVYLLHMGLFVALLVLGGALLPGGDTGRPASAMPAMLLLGAILIRCGTIPAHGWLTDWFQHASFGNALLLVTPLAGVYAAVRLLVPLAPPWALHTLGVFALATAVYAAGLATVQRDARRLFAYLFLSHASLVLLGVALHTSISLTGALALWVSVSLSLTGFGLTLRALEARFGRLSLAEFRGLYDHAPALAVCFVLTGLGSVGFPGTLGFVAGELVVDGAVKASVLVGLAVVLAAALNGIAIVRAYFRLFTGTRSASTVPLDIGPREQLAVLTLALLILGGGLYPQPGLASRHHAAEQLLQQRDQVLLRPDRPDLSSSANRAVPCPGRF